MGEKKQTKPQAKPQPAQAKPQTKRKGLGGLSPEKKKLLKQLIMQKAAEDMKKQQEMKAEEKQKFINSRVPKLDIDGLDQQALSKKVKELHDVVCRLEEEKYDWEAKIRRQDFEINDLNVKVNDIKGHFVKPVLKKVSKTEQKLAKFDKEKVKSCQGFRENLKSTGQSKFALEEKEETGKKQPEWSRDQLKRKDSLESEEKKDDDEAAEDEKEEEEDEDEE